MPRSQRRRSWLRYDPWRKYHYCDDIKRTDRVYHLQNGPAQPAIDRLLSLEKQTRQASDLPSTSRLLVAIVTIARDAKDWSLLSEQVQLLSKKHGQLKQAITKMVQVVMGFLDDTPTLETKLEVIETLRTVTEGKVSCKTPRNIGEKAKANGNDG